jgi:hypothetical protein
MDCSSPTNTRLNTAVDAIYRAFCAPTPPVIEGCPCCISKRGVDVLLTTPLRELTGQALWGYVSGVFLTVGGDNDFRYLLPRILDISANDAGNANDPEIVLGKLGRANWETWAPDERVAIEEFVDAWFERALATDIMHADDGWIGHEAEAVLGGAARAGMPLKRWLIRLNDPAAEPVLSDLKARYPDELSPFWEDEPSGFRELVTVLAQGEA